MNKKTCLLTMCTLFNSFSLQSCPTCLGRLKKGCGEPFFIKHMNATKKIADMGKKPSLQTQESHNNKSEGSHE